MVTHTTEATKTTEPPKLPPVWFKHLFWRTHRFLYRLLGDRVLWTPASKRGWGAMHVTTIGRRSGERRSVILGYIEDGSTPVVLAMNGWDEGLPAWWRNLEANPDAVIQLKGQPMRRARARRVDGDERDRLWRRWAEIDEGLDAYAASRSAETPVVVFEPRDVPWRRARFAIRTGNRTHSVQNRSRGTRRCGPCRTRPRRPTTAFAVAPAALRSRRRDPYRFEAEVWEHQGSAAWFFVSLPDETADDIDERYGHLEAGFGSLRVEVTIGSTTWRTSIFPDAKRGTYVLPVKKQVRTAEGLAEGSTCSVELRVVAGSAC